MKGLQAVLSGCLWFSDKSIRSHQ